MHIKFSRYEKMVSKHQGCLRATGWIDGNFIVFWWFLDQGGYTFFLEKNADDHSCPHAHCQTEVVALNTIQGGKGDGEGLILLDVGGVHFHVREAFMSHFCFHCIFYDLFPFFLLYVLFEL